MEVEGWGCGWVGQEHCEIYFDIYTFFFSFCWVLWIKIIFRLALSLFQGYKNNLNIKNFRKEREGREGGRRAREKF